MLIRAPWLLNPGQEPIRDACVATREELVVFAGKFSDLPQDLARDPVAFHFPDALLSPGFVNAHAHLELSALADFPYAGEFVAWVRDLLQAKLKLSPEIQEEKMREGIAQLLRGGTTCLADHMSVGGPLDLLLASPLRGKIFLEVLGVQEQVARDIYQIARQIAQTSTALNFEIIPSPHSVHALTPEILEKNLKQKASTFSIHLAESAAEAEYFSCQSGPFHDLIAQRGAALARSGRSAVRELIQRGCLSEDILLVHGNYLDVEELQALAERRISIVHCPFSHAYFGHRPFPMEEARKAGINVALGSDSLASAKTLSMLEIMRETERRFPELSQKEIFRMATLGGAHALKMQDQIGELTAGKFADLIAVPCRESHDPWKALFQAKQAEHTVIAGRLTKPNAIAAKTLP